MDFGYIEEKIFITQLSGIKIKLSHGKLRIVFYHHLPKIREEAVMKTYEYLQAQLMGGGWRKEIEDIMELLCHRLENDDFERRDFYMILACYSGLNWDRWEDRL